MRYDDIKIGDRVTSTKELPCYYSGYAGRPHKNFKPGDVAIVKSIKCPLVRKITKDDYFVFCIPESFEWSEGLGIPYSLIKKLEDV
jgi:hypothetical protein